MIASVSSVEPSLTRCLVIWIAQPGGDARHDSDRPALCAATTTETRPSSFRAKGVAVVNRRFTAQYAGFGRRSASTKPTPNH
jgi:hypothetical protein